ncbi:glycosyltransferase family 4 protein [Hanstruepera ponticola]|uniref:glycosyltransferase family 4 protein n=1 Tax=Hanstruepera ponticola TaxID=2042995 RepID=UPI0017800F96|nr:glycosyltransferase [Hanstruepera ponticola]
MKKRICIVMPWHISERGGGAEVQANYLSQALAERGFKVSYVCQTTTANKVNTHEVKNNVLIHWLKPSGRFHWMDQNKYDYILKKLQPEIIVQRLSSNVSYVIGKYCKSNSCKFIWICTDNLSPYKNYHVLKFKKNNTVDKVGYIKYHVFLKNAQIMDWFRNKGMKQVDIAFTQNIKQSKILENEFDMKSERMISGHPTPKFHFEPQTNFSKKTIIWCGNFGLNKRPQLFVELANALIERDYKFIMIGSHSDKAYVSSILKNKPDGLQVTGQLSFEESLSYFDKASLLVNTSKSEGFSNTYIQAWLRGLPTLVFGADPSDVIASNNLGYVCNDVSEAAKSIEKILSDFNEYEILANNTKTFATNHHTIEIMTDHFLSVLKQNKTSVRIEEL